MTSPRTYSRNGLKPGGTRAGFTLAELLIAMVVIAILASLLAPVAFNALKAAKEGAINLELKQIEVAMEEFNNKYGFYPPSFEGLTQGQLLAYINRMAPNHAELSPSGITGRSRFDHWWIEVGQYLDQESSLVFWLSGVCLNRQFPLTGGVTGGSAGIPPLAAHAFGNDGIARDIFFDFKTGQIYGDNPADEVIIPSRTGVKLLANQEGFILEYRHPGFGNDEGSEIVSSNGVSGTISYTYKYRDHATSYDLGTGNFAYYNGPNDGSALAPPLAQNLFANPRGFQLVSFGLDGLSGVPGNWNATKLGAVTLAGFDFYGPWGSDNLCNFADGRLEKWVIDNEQ